MVALKRIALAGLAPLIFVMLATTPANVSPPDPGARIDALTTQVAALERDNAVLRSYVETALASFLERDQAVTILEAKLVDLESRLAGQAGRPAETRASGRSGSLDLQVEELQDLLVHFRREGDDLYIEGANLHIVNGTDATDTTNGVGNLILGYNEERPAGNRREGSHVLVLGSGNNYSGPGGIVAGLGNEIGGEWAAVLGGTSNTAYGKGAVVMGGTGNTAGGPWSAVSGGAANHASGEGASVAGGGFNVASGRFSSVGGGMQNEAAGEVSVVNRGCDAVVTTCGGN